MNLTLTVWQAKKGVRPTRAGESRIEDPNAEDFGSIVAGLLATVAPPSAPFQIVAQVGCSSRALQLDQGWTDDRIASALWADYQSLARVNG